MPAGACNKGCLPLLAGSGDRAAERMPAAGGTSPQGRNRGRSAEPEDQAGFRQVRRRK